MLRAKREHDGYLAAFAAAVIVARIPFSGESLNPANLNPFREIDPAAQARLEAVRRFISTTTIAVQAQEGIDAARKKRGKNNGG